MTAREAVRSGANGEAFYAAIVEQIAHPIFVKDREYRWVVLNRAACELFGHKREELIGKSDFDFFPATEAEGFRASDRRVFGNAETVIIEEESITRPDGSVRKLATTKAPLFDETGAITHVVGIIHDITPIKLTEAALRVSNEALEASVEARTNELRDMQEALVRRERLAVLGQLAGGLAHQIRNPLAAMANAVAVLRRRLKKVLQGDLEAAQAIAIVDEEIWEANRIITDLIDFARVRPPTRKRVKVKALIDAALAHAKSELAFPVTVRGDSYLDVLVDERQCRDALANLVRNAFEAMGEEGSLTITCRDEGAFVVLAFVDTGPGIVESVRRRLFEPLNTSKPLGLGLGLATARSLVRNQGGDLVALPAVGGAHFEVSLPRDPSGTEDFPIVTG